MATRADRINQEIIQVELQRARIAALYEADLRCLDVAIRQNVATEVGTRRRTRPPLTLTPPVATPSRPYLPPLLRSMPACQHIPTRLRRDCLHFCTFARGSAAVAPLHI